MMIFFSLARWMARARRSLSTVKSMIVMRFSWKIILTYLFYNHFTHNSLWLSNNFHQRVVPYPISDALPAKAHNGVLLPGHQTMSTRASQEFYVRVAGFENDEEIHPNRSIRLQPIPR